MTLNWLSDSETGPALTPLVAAIMLIETGSAQDVSSTIKQLSGLSNLTVRFTSDAEAVPIPRALPLFATGLGPLGLLSLAQEAESFCLIKTLDRISEIPPFSTFNHERCLRNAAFETKQHGYKNQSA